jgi:hypothetical protein
MIRKLKSGQYRVYYRKKNPKFQNADVPYDWDFIDLERHDALSICFVGCLQGNSKINQ